MNAFLLSLGLALLAVLCGALAAPFFIDWSSQRGFFEARAAEMLGRPVEFAGSLDVRIVPFPRLTAEDVRIGDPDGQQEGAERVTIRAALTPLLSGELEISEIVLTRPRITLGLDAEGGLGWTAARGDQILPVPAERARLERLEVVEGTVIVEDAIAGTTIEMTGLNLTGSAGSLAGPFRIEGGGLVDGRRYTLRVGTGRMQNGVVRLTASIVPADRPLTVELDGSLELSADSPARYRGGVVVQRPAVGGGIVPWRVESDVVATAHRVAAETLNVSIGPETERLALAGVATVDLGAVPRFDLTLNARQLDFDRAYGGGGEATAQSVLARMAELLDSTAHFGTGRLSLEIGSVVLAGNLLEGVEAEMILGSEGWHVAEARGQGPGMTDARFAGTVTADGGVPAVEGRLQLDSRQSGVLAGWLFGPEMRVPGLGAVAGPVAVAADLSYAEDAIALTGLEIASADMQLSGEIAYGSDGEGGRPSLAARIETDRLSFDGLRRTATGSPFADMLGIVAGTDIDLALDAGVVHVGGVDLSEVTVVVAMADDEVRIDRLRIGDLGGARIDGHGEIGGIFSTPRGRLEVDIEAEALDAVANVLAELGLPEAAEALTARAGALVPVELALSLDAVQQDEGGSRADVAVSGMAGSTSVDLSIGFEGRTDRLAEAEMDISLTAANPHAARLVEQIGLFPAGDGAEEGRVELTARGRPVRAVAFVLTTDGLGVDGRAEGDLRLPPRGGREVAGSYELVVARPTDLLGAAGIALPLTDAPPVAVAGRLSVDDSVWRLSELTAEAGGANARGSLAVDLGSETAIVDGALELGRIELPWLLGALFGPGAFGPPADLDEAAWSREAFNPAELRGWRGRLRLSAPQLYLGGGFAASEAALDLQVSPGRVVLDRLRGGMFGGRLSGDLELASLEGAVQFEGRLALDDARLEEFVWHSGGRAMAAGTVSIGAELAATGRSLLGLVSTLSGGGSLRVEDGVIRRMNPRAFDHIVRAADAGLPLEEEDVRNVFAGHLDAGSLLFEQAEGSFSIAGGVVRTRNIRLDGAPLDSFASASLDLTDLDVHSEWLLRVAAPAADARAREVAIVFTGPMETPRRTIDVAPLLGYLNVRAFEQEVKRLEELQTEINMRNWRRHELMRFGRDLRRFERERADRMRRLEDEALEPPDEVDATSDAGADTDESAAAPATGGATAPAPVSRAEQVVRDALRARPGNAVQRAPGLDLMPQGTGQPMNIVPPAVGEERTTR